MNEGRASRKLEQLVLVLLLLGSFAISGCLGEKSMKSAPEVEIKTGISPDSGVSQMVTSGERLAEGIPSAIDFGIPDVTALSEGQSTRGIIVSGVGKASVTPDVAVLTVGFVNTAESSQDVLSENSEAMSSIIEAIKDSGVEDRDIRTQSVNIWPVFDYGVREEKVDLPTIIGYRAENRVVVKIRDISKAGEVIDASSAAGSNQIYGISFTISDETSKSLRSQVLKAAVLDAEDKALAIAEALGVDKITPVRVVESSGYTPPLYRYDLAAVEAAAVPTPVSPGEMEVTASLQVTFDFEP